jgi:hypothetical protein
MVVKRGRQVGSEHREEKVYETMILKPLEAYINKEIHITMNN